MFVNKPEAHKMVVLFVASVSKLIRFHTGLATLQYFHIETAEKSSRMHIKVTLYLQVWKKYEFWCEGILFGIFGLFGLIFNLTSVLTLTSKEMRKHTFNQLLAILTLCETL